MKILPVLLSISCLAVVPLSASPDVSSQPGISNADGAKLEYKVISGYKQAFNDDLQLHLSKGWRPVGGVSVTTWNNDLFFAQLLCRPVTQ